MEARYVTDCDCYLAGIRPVEGVRIPSQADIFGAASVVEERPDGILEAFPVEQSRLTDSYVYQGIVLAVFMLLCYLINSYRSSLAIVFKILTGRLTADKVFDEYPLFFRKFLSVTTLWGILLIGGLLIRYGALYGVDAQLPRQVPFVTELACVAVLLAATVVVLYRRIVTGIIGGVIRNELFFEKLRFTTRIFSSFIYILLTPLFLIVALTDGAATDRLLHITAVFAGILYILYLSKSYRFFVIRDVSILQWILYLCIVEFFPISFFVLVVARNC